MAQNPHDDPKRTTPVGMARYGCDFLEAAIAVDGTVGRKPGFEMFPPIPVFYLICHAIELLLKAFLLQKGVPLADLRKKIYGHSLHACFRKCKELGLLDLVQFHDDEAGAVELLDTYYSTKQFEYIVTGAKTFPAFPLILGFAHKLRDAVAPFVGYAKKRVA
jgi:hypothetical protein